jgi:hypothetical protein
MTMTLSGDGTITGLVAGGLPDATITTDELAAGAALNNAPNSVGFRNRIINGDMRIDQRNAGAAVTAAGYTVDRFSIANTTDGAFSAQQDSSAPTGFVNSLKVTTTTADATLTTTQVFILRQFIEGNNVADLGWGTANAKTITLSFWVRSSLTGTFGGALINSSSTRSYPFTYSISVADTWEQKSITIAGDTTGTWLTDTGNGIRVTFSLGSGPDRSGTAGAWAGSNFTSATGAVSVIGTLNATWYVTGVQLEVGSVATPFERRPFGAELALCQRYYQRIQGDTSAQRSVGIGTVGSATQIFRISVPMKTNMRAAPTCSASGLTGYDSGNNAAVSLGTGYQTSEQISFDVSGGSGYTIGRAGVLLTGGSSTSYFDASAEL